MGRSFRKKPNANGVRRAPNSSVKKSVSNEAERTSSNGAGAWSNIVKENPLFQKYYKDGLGICKNEEEWQSFVQHLKDPLPINFRFTGSRSTSFELRDLMKSMYFEPLSKLTLANGKKVSPPQELEWYPNSLGWQFNMERSQIKHSPEVASFRRFLMSETEVGNISRQEAVSMIPPLFLDIKSHHYILDMCAAPGSKTAQIMEALHAQDALNCSSSSGGDGDECMSNIPKGLIIANDSDYDRACMLVHQTSRIQSPCLLVTNHEAQSFPNIVLSQQDSSSTNIEGGGNNGKKFLMFDRILADVPCSGDGTMRKNPRIWNTWDGHSGNALHRLQMQILERGLQMTKVGGRIVYSTCSFNPVENEAVVAALLNMAKGSLKIVDVSDQYPKLKRNPGLTSWKVMDKKGNMYSSLDEVDQPHQKNIYASSFPPSNAKELGLEKCMRVLPFQQNTGGFFIVVLEKTSEYVIENKKRNITTTSAINSIATGESVVAGTTDLKRKVSPEVTSLVASDLSSNTTTEVTQSPPPPQPVASNETDSLSKKLKLESDEGVVQDEIETATAAGFSENPAKPEQHQATESSDKVDDIVGQGVRISKHRKAQLANKDISYFFLEENSPEVQSVSKFYKLKSSFPLNQFVAKSDNGKSQNLYFLSLSAKSVLQAKNSEKVKILNCGIKLFSRQSYRANQTRPDCDYRFNSDGLDILQNVVDDKFKIHIQVDDLLVLLTQEHPKIESFSDSLKEKLSSRLGSMTSAIISCEPNQENYVKQTVFAPVWIGKNSMSLLVDKHECRAIYFRFTGKELLDRQAMVVEKKVAEEEGKKKDDVEVLNQVEMVNKVVA